MPRVRTLATILFMIIVPSLFIYFLYYDTLTSSPSSQPTITRYEPQEHSLTVNTVNHKISSSPLQSQPQIPSLSPNLALPPYETPFPSLPTQSNINNFNSLHQQTSEPQQQHKYSVIWRHLNQNNYHQINANTNHPNKKDEDFTYVPIKTPRIPPPNETMDPDPEIESRRQLIKQMMREAWDNYARYAWGYNELQPITRNPKLDSIFGDTKLGLTIVDSMDTLWIMDMKKEFEDGKRWIAKELNFKNVGTEISIFETIIRYVGGLLTCFAFTGDPMFLFKAKDIAKTLLPAYNTATGVPNGLIIPLTGKSFHHTWAHGAILSEFGSHHLEYTYLSDMTNDQRFSDRVKRIRKVVKNMDKPNGLYHLMMDNINGRWTDEKSSLGALGDSFYEYLIKSYVQSGHRDTEALEMYINAMDAIDRSGMINQSHSGKLTYVSDINFGQPTNKMQHLTCFAGGMYMLGVHHMLNNLPNVVHDGSGLPPVNHSDPNLERINRHFRLAVNLTETCYQSYHRTPTHLGPEAFYFDEEFEALNRNGDYYILRPEVIESYFVMWRMTHDKRYRDYAWEAAQAIFQHCRTGHGYSGLHNVMKLPPTKDNTQQSFFLAETLKYLYLIFSNDKLLPLDQWVFNTEAHPLPICGFNPAYPIETCNHGFQNQNLS